MNSHALERMALENHLRHAIERGELFLSYQPQMSLGSRGICGVEALIRWHSPELGVISPADFIPLAENTGLILPIGEWVLRTACLQNKAWQDANLPTVRVAVNVSGHQITAGNLVFLVDKVLNETGLDPRYLEIELTESVLMHDTELTLKQITDLRQMGVSISLDDFGTGYSSLGYLSRFTIDRLKIDQGFISNITTNHRSAAIAKATIALAQSLGMIVIAEGVETEGQLGYLSKLGCDEIQGYLFSRPIPPDELAIMIGEEQTLRRGSTN
jgi:EAL domain-containing protein (putative c-di-GMP-specific phosphodiesterase class I)